MNNVKPAQARLRLTNVQMAAMLGVSLNTYNNIVASPEKYLRECHRLAILYMLAVKRGDVPAGETLPTTAR